MSNKSNEVSLRETIKARMLELLPTWDKNSKNSFRKAVIDPIAAEQNLKIKTCKGAYQSVLRKMRAEQPELVAGIGREEGKRGGRPRKSDAIYAEAAALIANHSPETTQEQAPEVVAESETRTVYRLTNKVKGTYKDYDTSDEAETARKKAKMSKEKLDWAEVQV